LFVNDAADLHPPSSIPIASAGLHPEFLAPSQHSASFGMIVVTDNYGEGHVHLALSLP
jgi:hypothetical protein